MAKYITTTSTVKHNTVSILTTPPPFRTSCPQDEGIAIEEETNPPRYHHLQSLLAIG